MKPEYFTTPPTELPTAPPTVPPIQNVVHVVPTVHNVVYAQQPVIEIRRPIYIFNNMCFSISYIMFIGFYLMSYAVLGTISIIFAPTLIIPFVCVSIIGIYILIVEFIIRPISWIINCVSCNTNVHFIHHIIDIFLPGWMLFYMLNRKRIA